MFKNQANDSLAGALLNLDSTLKTQRSEITSQTIAAGVTAGMESFGSVPERENFLDSMGNTQRKVKDILTTAGYGMEAFGEAQLEAGAVVAMAGSNLTDYARAGYHGEGKPSANGVRTVEGVNSGAHGNVDSGFKPAMESFDENELQKMLPRSIAWNVMASRQDGFSEAFYPTIVLTPDQVGVELSCRRTLVFNAVRHAGNGQITDFNKRNLVDGFSDYKVLANESTTLTPYLLADGSNEEFFVDSDDVKAKDIVINNETVHTAPLRADVQIDLLGVCATPGTVEAGLLDNTDAIDAQVALRNLYVRVSSKEAGKSEVIKFYTERMTRSNFQKSVEGDFREMTLQFNTNALLLTPDTRLADGSEPTLLDSILAADYEAQLQFMVNGTLNVERGDLIVQGGFGRIKRIQDKDENIISLKTGAGKEIMDDLTFEVIGYDLEARRNNTNRRTRGMLLDFNTLVERYPVALGAPMSIPTPINMERDASDLEALVQATRIRNSNNAVTRLLNYADTLREVVSSNFGRFDDLQIEGIGRALVRPYFEEIELDLKKVIASLSSAGRAADVSAAIVNTVTAMAYRMYSVSGYAPALEVFGQPDERPTLLIGTDNILPQFMMIQGDLRTAGVVFNTVIKSTPDRRMVDKIVFTITRGVNTGPDPLTFGMHIWIPELASTAQVSRNGATYKETMVQPRNRHINQCPMLGMIHLKNVTEAFSGQVALNVVDATTEADVTSGGGHAGTAGADDTGAGPAGGSATTPVAGNGSTAGTGTGTGANASSGA